jgi:gamma-glutamyl-gamma-aminobutyrate hydrolase PuuD
VIEAIEDPTLSYCLGVQWHPEADGDSPIIATLVAEAARRLDERASAAPSVVARVA